jgi:hypothetical protein
LKWKDIDILGVIFSSLGIFLLVLGILLLNNPKNWLNAFIFISIGIILL